jgi:hypothetical protein
LKKQEKLRHSDCNSTVVIEQILQAATAISGTVFLSSLLPILQLNIADVTATTIEENKKGWQYCQPFVVVFFL